MICTLFCEYVILQEKICLKNKKTVEGSPQKSVIPMFREKIKKLGLGEVRSQVVAKIRRWNGDHPHGVL